MRKIALALALAMASPLVGNERGPYSKQYYPVHDRLEVTSLDGTWQFKWDNEKQWHDVSVPGNLETQGLKTPQYGRELNKMTGVYKRHFQFQQTWKGKDVILRLDGVQNGFTLFVNNHEVGSGHSAHTMHQFCVTPYLKDGGNEIKILFSTHSDYWGFDVCDAWSLTGIKRNVELFPVSKEGSISDIRFVSKVNQDNSSDINIKVFANGGNYVTASLLDERYNHVADLNGRFIGDSVNLSTYIQYPRLWNAETPNLYRLDVKLYNADNKLLQTIHEKVGIREVRTDGGKILLNNKEIFLRGVCLSENDAIEGGAMSLLHRRQQLQQVKEANINFIRTAHYPQNWQFTRLCDEIGFYVCEEIPFASRGSMYLKSDSNVISELCARAKASIDRDRNCPSIIVWSHGNENHYFACEDSVLKFTKEYDPTRLRGLPQTPGPFFKYLGKKDKYANVMMGHYFNEIRLRMVAEQCSIPMINTEYAHSLGTSSGDLESHYEIFRNTPNIAGGSVWCFQDQSILTHNFNQQNQVLKGVRIDSLRFIDSYGLRDITADQEQKEGTDGIVYGDGYPQEDYFHLAQVYTPVFLSKTDKAIEVENRFDFITLHGYTVRWQLKHFQQVLKSGTYYLSAEARSKEQIGLELLGIDENGDEQVLCMQVLRPDGSLCFVRNFQIGNATDFESLLMKEANTKDIAKAIAKAKSIYLRVGRPLTISLDFRRKGMWMPYILKPMKIKVKKQRGGYLIACRWYKNDSIGSKEYFDGEITLTPTVVDYTITPSDKLTGKIYEFGLTFMLPEKYTDVAWYGQGPFSHVPDKQAYNNLSTWQLNKDDIRFYGNRGEVKLMTFLSSDNNLTLCSKSGNILIENIDGMIAFTDNLFVGGYASKMVMPKFMDAKKLGKQTGRLILNSAAEATLKSIFGTLAPVNPENPYLESYGK